LFRHKRSTVQQGCAGAIGGALVGGWLGFHTLGGFAAVGPTIIGALAGANLVLIALDIATARSQRRRATTVAIDQTRAPAHT
jgi:outer membrane lipoprotein SlyB